MSCWRKLLQAPRHPEQNAENARRPGPGRFRHHIPGHLQDATRERGADTSLTGRPLKLWALNSTPENRALRNLLTQKLGSAPARRLLATHFPQGSASAHIDNLKSQSRDDDHTSAVNKLAAELIARHGYLQG